MPQMHHLMSQDLASWKQMTLLELTYERDPHSVTLNLKMATLSFTMTGLQRGLPGTTSLVGSTGMAALSCRMAKTKC